MKTLKELADLGAAAAFADNSRWHYMAVSKDSHGWESDEPARQAFAQAVRDAVKAWLKSSGVRWLGINQALLDNDILADVRNNPDDCTDDELRQVIGMRSQLEAMKGGAK